MQPNLRIALEAEYERQHRDGDDRPEHRQLDRYASDDEGDDHRDRKKKTDANLDPSMRRAGMDAPTRLAVKRAYALLYREGLNFRDAAAAIAAQFPDGPARELADFVTTAKRGLAPFSARRAGGESVEEVDE